MTPPVGRPIGRPLRILLLVADASRHTGTVADHIGAFELYSKHEVVVLDSGVSAAFAVGLLDLNAFDAVVFHYSIVISLPGFLPAAFADRLSKFSGTKILFIQDEFRWVNRTCAAIERLGISVVFTVVNPNVTRKIYRTPYFDEVRFEHTLTGFVPEGLVDRRVPSYAERTIDVSYRARKLPGWCGSFALQKWQIAERFRVDAERYGLKFDCNTSEAGRIYGERWIDFVSNSKATLGTESGASFVDYTGEVYQAVEAYERDHPCAPFEEVRDRFLKGRDGDLVIHVISPRVFEAAALKTLMVLYPGEYSGVLKSGRHYVELKPDHSNIEEVVSVLSNPKRAGEIVDRAYREVAVSGRWSFRAFIAHFDRVADETVPAIAVGRCRWSRAKLMEEHDKRLRWERRRMAFVLRLQALRSRSSRIPQFVALRAGLARFVRATLPDSDAESLLRACRRAAYAVKSALKTLLLPGWG